MDKKYRPPETGLSRLEIRDLSHKEDWLGVSDSINQKLEP